MSDHDSPRARDSSSTTIGDWGAIGEHGYQSGGASAPAMPSRWDLGLNDHFYELLRVHLGGDETSRYDTLVQDLIEVTRQYVGQHAHMFGEEGRQALYVLFGDVVQR